MLGALKDLFHRRLTNNSQLAGSEPAYSRAEDCAKAPNAENQTLTKDSEGSQPNKFCPALFDEVMREPVDDEVSTGLQGLPNKALNYAAEKDNFLSTYGHDYGYNGQLAQMRMNDFRRLHEHVYLDYAGAALYSESQIKDSARDLMDQLLCNPHSSTSSSFSSEALEALRRDTLALLNADGRQYEVVITSGATAALKLVAESFPWSPGVSTLAHPLAVHNSVLGMRGPALAAGAAVRLVRTVVASRDVSALEDGAEAARRQGPSNQVVAVVGNSVSGRQSALTEDRGGRESPLSAAYHLLALPVECNFTGDREPHLEAVVRYVRQFGIDMAAGVLTTAMMTSSAACGNGKGIAKPEDKDYDVARRYGGGGDGYGGDDAGGYDGSDGHRWLVLLDAAKACATAPPDLSAVPADFVVLSYYKIFGHPTGLGALVVRREALALLAARKTYFGGGTVEVAVANRAFQVRRPGPAGLEDGTPPFTAIVAARHGFAFLHRIGGLPAVHRHSRCLARWLAARLAALRHANGAPVCALYGTWCRASAATASDVCDSEPCRGLGSSTSFANPPSPSDRPNDGNSVSDHGATLAFNLRRADGSWVGYAEVGRLAAMHGVHLRTGCVCNPGACASWLGWSAEDLIRHHSSGHVCWDDHDLADGRPTGAVRVSLGAANSFADVFKLLQLIVTYFLDKSRDNAAADGIGNGDGDMGLEGGISSVSNTGRQPSAGSSRTVHMGAAAPPAAVSATCTNTESTGDEAEPSAARLRVVAASSKNPQCECGVQLPPPPSLQHPHPCIARNVCSQTSNSAGGGGGGEGGGGGGGGGSKAAVGRLTGIRLYPVKSCAAQVVEAWPVGPTGLLYDREWALVDDGGKVLTLKQCPRMALIRPVVDLLHGTLTIHPPTATDLNALELAIPGIHTHPPTTTPKAAASKDGVGGAAAVCRTVTGGAAVRQMDAVRLDAGLTLERVQVCGDTVCTDLVDVSQSTQGEDRVRNWFARALGAPCRVVQQRTGARKVRRPTGQPAPSRHPTSSAAASAPAAAKRPGAQGPVAFAATTDGLVDEVVDGDSGRTGSTQFAASGEHQRAVVEPAVGFANDGQYLLVSEESMADLHQRILALHRTVSEATQPSSHAAAQPLGSSTHKHQNPQYDDLLIRLRPNLVVAGFEPYTEDHWAAVRVGPLSAAVLGTCPRCELLQVDPRLGVRRGSEVLVALAQYRRFGGRVQFGVLLAEVAAGPGQPLAAAAAASSGQTWTAEEPASGFGSVLESDSGLRNPHVNPGGVGKTNVSDPAVSESSAAGVSTGLDSETDAVGVERLGTVVQEGMAEWLRRRFGQLAVVAVGDVVVPMNAAV